MVVGMLRGIKERAEGTYDGGQPAVVRPLP
jgi:hypothetical protein